MTKDKVMDVACYLCKYHHVPVEDEPCKSCSDDIYHEHFEEQNPPVGGMK